MNVYQVTIFYQTYDGMDAKDIYFTTKKAAMECVEKNKKKKEVHLITVADICVKERLTKDFLCRVLQGIGFAEYVKEIYEWRRPDGSEAERTSSIDISVSTERSKRIDSCKCKN